MDLEEGVWVPRIRSLDLIEADLLKLVGCSRLLLVLIADVGLSGDASDSWDLDGRIGDGSPSLWLPLSKPVKSMKPLLAAVLVWSFELLESRTDMLLLLLLLLLLVRMVGFFRSSWMPLLARLRLECLVFSCLLFLEKRPAKRKGVLDVAFVVVKWLVLESWLLLLEKHSSN